MPNRLAYKNHYKRKLPHYQTNNAIFFVTFRLAGSLPKNVVLQLSKQDMENKIKIMTETDPDQLNVKLYTEQKCQFARWDNALDTSESGPKWMNQKEIAKIVFDTLHYHDNRKYSLTSFCIMPNHVHAVFSPLKNNEGKIYPLSEIMHSIKSYSGNMANKILNRKGSFWNHESYDHVVRDEDELKRIIQYVINNPKKAGLVEKWEDWQWTYVKQSSLIA